MKIKVSKAINIQLDWLVAKCQGVTEHDMGRWRLPILEACTSFQYSPSSHWSQGGPIIEREKIRFDDLPDNGIRAFIRRPAGKSEILLMDCWDEGITPLIAAMRCYVVSKLGDEVEVPDELVDS